MKVTQSSHINNQVWLPTKVEKISPMYDDATLTAIMEYSDVKINQGLNSSLFEFQE
jgi:outer membrane lipoprotein-sorting protein